MIDNSASMADKQQILAASLPLLVAGLVNPPCVDANGVPSAMQPANPSDACPDASTKRAFVPVADLHLGVITSSLGGHGSDACPASQPTADDHGHLLSRTDPSGMGGSVPTYQNEGFLAFDPQQKLSPPGEANAATIEQYLHDMVLGTGQMGCGFESQLESWYRFLVDPDPYDTISVVNGKATPSGVDAVLLKQRADFLRPDSVLAVVMLSDEDDCSTKEYSQFYLANQIKDPSNPNKLFHLPEAREECDSNPADNCCASCGQQAPMGCPASPRCSSFPFYGALDDNLNVRCFDQKRRFGIDFLYPTDRYVQGLTAPQVPDSKGQLVANPVFSNLSGDPSKVVRGPNLVFLAGLVGVPWQDLARDPKDISKGFKTAKENLVIDNNGFTTWDNVIGDPPSFTAPVDPLMKPSIDPRMGFSPKVNASLGAPGANTPLSNPANGKEYDIPNKDDLQYACIFDLPMARDCSQPNAGPCDCGFPTDSPLCNGTTQIKAKAYPGIRELTVLKGVGDQGIAGTICPAQTNNPMGDDYGYRPSLAAITAALSTQLVKP